MADDSLKGRITRNEKDIQSIGGRVSELEKNQWTLSKDSEYLQNILIDLKVLVADLDATMTSIQMKPGKDFENYKTKVWTTIIGVVVAYLIGKYL